MKYKTLFRLMVKCIGIYLFAFGAYTLAPSLVTLIYTYSRAGGPVYGREEWYRLLSLSGPLVFIAFGLYLFFGGKWLVDKAIPSNRPYCHECGYDLTAATQNRCPECGTPFRPEDVMPQQDEEKSESTSSE